MSEDSSNKSAKYKQIMETAKVLFWKHGISRVTVTEICKEAGVSKMTFYRHFDDKVDLAKKSMKQSADEALAQYRAIMDQDIPFHEKIKQAALLKMEGTKDISEELLADVYKNPELGLMPYLQEVGQESMRVMMEDYIKAQQEGEVRKDLNPQFILYFLNKMNEMMADPALDGMYATPNDRIMEIFNFFFYGILSRDQES